MAYDVTIDEKGDYIKCEVSGERRHGKEIVDIATVWSQVAQLCKEKGIFKILAIFKLKGQLAVFDAFKLVKTSKKFNWDSRFILALYDANKDSRKINLFVETVAVNRGYYIKVFENEESALNWLIDS